MPYGRARGRSATRRSATNRYSTRKKTSYYSARKGPYRRKYYKSSRKFRAQWTNPMSQEKLVKFTYADTGFSRTLTPANSYSSAYIFRGASVYDPDYTGVGVQPYSLDDYLAADKYQSFSCPSSSIRVYFRPEQDFASIRRLHCFVFPHRMGSGLTLTDVSDVRMIPYCRETVYDGETESTKGCKMKHYCRFKDMYKEVKSFDFNYAGNYTGNPTSNWYWYILFFTDVYDDEEVDIYFDVKIRYYTKLTRGGTPNES